MWINTTDKQVQYWYRLAHVSGLFKDAGSEVATWMQQPKGYV